MTNIGFIYLSLIWSFVSLHQSTAVANSAYQILVQPVYVAFTSDLIVNYSIPKNVSLPNAFIRVLALTHKGQREITTLKIHFGRSTGTGSVKCGLIETAGQHMLEMHMYLGGRVLTSTPFMVRWPKLHLSLPESHIAQTDAVTLSYASEATCSSILHRHTFQIELEYRKDIHSNPSFYTETPKTIHTQSILDISQSKGSITYDCDVFDVSGVYNAILKSSYNTSAIISRSNYMDVKWSNNYPISVYRNSIFPCNGHLTVLYVHPQCPGANDKIRMFLLKRETSGSLAAPLLQQYVSERHAHPDKTFVVFDCDLFQTTAVGYCFVYVSMSRSGIVTEQNRSCMAAHEGAAIPVDGGWNEWSEWGSCSVTCETGKRSRFRYCNKPTPAHGGRFCNGPPMEWQPCFTICPDSIPKTPLHSPVINQKCPCGCTLESPEGEIIATGRCMGHSHWLIKVKINQVIRLTFQFFDLYEDKQWVKVRNGEKTSSDLLAISYGDTILTEVTSTSDSMLIEFMTRDTSDSSQNSYTPFSKSSKTPSNSPEPFHQIPTQKIHVYGFIATYTSFNKKATYITAAIPLQIESKPERYMWESVVTIVGIALCVVIVLVLVAVTVYHRCFRKNQHKYKMAEQTESPSHIPKSTSMHSTPSHHSALSGIEIDYDMERPLTGQTKKSSRHSSISSNRSNGRSVNSKGSKTNKMRFKTKADIETGGSPKPPVKHYTPLPSPHVQATIEANSDEKSGLFNTSPLAGRRSPKVHPSTKMKQVAKVKTPSSPKETKYDLLTKRRLSGGKAKEPRTVEGFPTDKGIKVFEKPSSRAATPLSSGSLTPTPRPFIASPEVNSVQSDNNRTLTRNPDGRDKLLTPTPRTASFHELNVMEKSDHDDMRKSASGASDDSQSPDKVCNGQQQTTSFIENPSDSSVGRTKPRRPTSLTESYSKLPIFTPSSAENGQDINNSIANIDRHNDLPKPDGQSPKTTREENSKNSTPRSIRSSKSKQTLSPSRSITTPSDNLEMEYDDFIDMDDTYSYFDPVETEKLQWKGAEKIGKNGPIEEEETN